MLPDLTEYIWIAWLVLALLFIIIELLTLEFTFLMLAAGSLIGGLGTNLLGGPWWLQVGLAAALSALLLFTIRPLLLRLLHRGSEAVPMNVDALFGMLGRVVVPVTSVHGSVRLDNGETWTARLADSAPGTTLDVGTRVHVVAVLGATVEVAPASQEPPRERTADDG
ncbi:NfeD family protein [Microbacterium ulmi]|uniref:NfeD family protein n=1 Tax=Microbacterium ulmi TaxID=179095 RepID=A0A7Y2LYH9_9MICO|nr:NfeD family protein [Microbacterium ulmi]NNH02912.1 NfeD family protein [Microbacterium ulmi]